jgi:hypothetical protein
MGFLEDRFRRQFRAEGTGYVFRLHGHDVAFSADEVEEFVEDWKLLWLAPWLWAGWLLIGVVAPLWLAWSGYPAGSVILGLFAAGFMVVVLLPPLRRPGEVAETMLPDDAPHGEGPWAMLGWLVFTGLFFLLLLWQAFETGFVRLGDLSLALFMGGLFAARVWEWRRLAKGAAPGIDRSLWGTLIYLAGPAAVLVATALYPRREDGDLWFAGGAALVLVFFGATALWRWLRGSRPEAVA